MTHYLVLTTCPDKESAERIGTFLVEQRLAACVNLLPAIQSIYRWKGEVTRDEELLLVIKSRAERFEALKQAILDHHPYELPEVIAVSVSEGHIPYLAWIDSQLDYEQ